MSRTAKQGFLFSRLFASASFLLLIMLSTTAWGQKVNKAALFEGNADLRKVSSHLLQARADLDAGADMQALRQANQFLKGQGNQIKIEIRLQELNPSLLKQISAAGVSIETSFTQYAMVTGSIAADQLDELAAIPQVATIHPQYGSINRTGSVANQADVSINTDDARSTFGVDGTGVNIGILSDSFYDLILGTGTISGSNCTAQVTGSDPQVSGDIADPAFVLDNGAGGGTDEGAGIAELIADMVPMGVPYFHTAGTSEAAFAAGIGDLVACGSHVIVDDVLFLAEPMFQDGPVAQAAQAAVDAGIPFLTAAGNDGTTGVDEFFVDSNVINQVTFGDDFHLFPGGNGDAFASVTFPPGCDVTFIMQWDNPFDGTLGPGATTDLDLYLCTGTTAASCTVDASIAGQGDCAGTPGGDPFEVIQHTNMTGVDEDFFIAIDHWCNASGETDTSDMPEIRIATFTNCPTPTPSITFEGGIFDKSQIYDHPLTRDALAVGAVFYGEIDMGGSLIGGPEINVEDFSSLGGDHNIYFGPTGLPLPMPEMRFAPQIAGPDGTNTTFFGNDIGFDADSFPNFFGTSASAPHAAAVAALLLDASPDIHPLDVNAVLKYSSRDIEIPGIDNRSGYGLIDGHRAVQTVSNIGTGCIPELYLGNHLTSGTNYFRACDMILTGGIYGVSTGGSLTMDVGPGGNFLFNSGFKVEPGAELIIRIVPSLVDPDP